MASYEGYEGLIYIGSNIVGECSGWDFTETAALHDNTTLVSSTDTDYGYIKQKAGLKSGSGSINCKWDPDNAEQAMLRAGASVTLLLYPEGKASTNTELSVPCIVGEMAISAAVDGGDITASFPFSSNGKITYGAVV